MADTTDPSEKVVIVGGGLAGLSLAHWLVSLDSERGPQVELLEAGPKPGGLIWTHSEAGYLVESGPLGWMGEAAPSADKDSRRLAAPPALAELVSNLGLDDQLIKVKLADHPRYVARKSKLHPLPQSPLKVVFSGLAGPGAKLRLIRELRMPPVAEPGLSVADWAARRFGSGLLDLFDAMATGIYAGDIQRMSVDHTFPTLRGLERKLGSVLRFAYQNRARLAESRMVAPKNGMGALMEQMAQSLVEQGVKIYPDEPATGVEATPGNFKVHTAGGSHRAERVILALAPNQARTLLDEELQEAWPEQSTAPIAVVGLGFRESAFKRPLRGFGYLLPSAEGAFSLGTLLPSSVLPDRAPSDHHLLQTLVGGVRHPDRAALPEAELLEGCLKDLGRYLKFIGGAPPEPVFTHVLRHPVGIPQLELGHEKLLARVVEAERAYPGLHFTGMGYHTVAVAGVVEETRRLAKKILQLK